MQERRPATTLTEARPRRVLPILLAIAAAVVAADQVTKTWALNVLDDHDIHVVSTLRLHLVLNKGGAFGLGTGSTWFFVVAPALVVTFVLVFGRRLLTSRLALAAMGLVLGGAVGNLSDRLLRDTGGAVVDFLDLRWWPVFNVADSAVVIGGLLFVLAGAFEPGATAGAATADADADADADAGG